MTRLTEEIAEDLGKFVHATADAWIAAGLIKPNSWGVEIQIAQQLGDNFDFADGIIFCDDHPKGKHRGDWYVDNGQKKNLVSLETGMDSLVAVRLHPGLIVGLKTGFPWGGAVIDTVYGILVGPSGFREDEDVNFARTIRDRVVMLLNRQGQAMLDDARNRGKDDAEDPSDRFIRPLVIDFGEGPIGRGFSTTGNPNAEPGDPDGEDDPRE